VKFNFQTIKVLKVIFQMARQKQICHISKQRKQKLSKRLMAKRNYKPNKWHIKMPLFKLFLAIVFVC